MSQMPLFESSSETVLVDDELGRVAYTPGFVAVDRAEAWFAELRDGVAWQTQRRRMYDRDVDVPRLQAHFSLDEDDSVPEAIRIAAGKVVAFTGVPFTSAGLNFYRDGRDSVAPHNDQPVLMHRIAVEHTRRTQYRDSRTRSLCEQLHR